MRAAFLLVLYILIVIALTPFVLVCLITGIREPLIVAGKLVMAVSRPILGIKVEVKGLDLLDREKAYIFMANHESFLDGPLLFYLIPRLPRVILKKSIFRIPVLGQGMKHVGFVPVDRKGVKGGKVSIDLASRLIKERGYSFLIFPEGTRTLDGRIQAFRRGGFFLALAGVTPIVPVSINGTFELMPKGRFKTRKGRVSVLFHQPIVLVGYDRGNLDGLMAKVKAAIESGLDKPGSVEPGREASPSGEVPQGGIHD